jgi:5-methylcytosine-specific restriction endonuclease McrA
VSSSFARVEVAKRDKGICALCGVDTVKLKAELHRLKTRAKRLPRTSVPCRAIEAIFGQLDALGFNLGGVFWWGGSTLWEADHIVPVVRGGGDCGLENYRTLCTPCHKLETARLARSRADERRGQLRLA